MDSVMLWVIVAIVALVVVAAFAGRRGTTVNPPNDGATPYDRHSQLGGFDGGSGSSDAGGGGSPS